MHAFVRAIQRQYLGALALVGLVVVVAGSASGATGDFLRLGRVNVGDGTTRLRNAGDGPTLQLLAKAGQPALSVSNSTLVPRLNAALLGGKPASAFAASDGPQLLYYLGSDARLSPPKEIVSIGSARVMAPADGVITVLAEGRCRVTKESMLLVTTVVSGGTGDTFDAPYDGYCSNWNSAEVKAGQKVNVGGSIASFPIDPAAAGSFDGTFEVVFQPK